MEAGKEELLNFKGVQPPVTYLMEHLKLNTADDLKEELNTVNNFKEESDHNNT